MDKGVDVVGGNVVAEFVCYDEVPFAVGWGEGTGKTLRQEQKAERDSK